MQDTIVTQIPNVPPQPTPEQLEALERAERWPSAYSPEEHRRAMDALMRDIKRLPDHDA